MRPEAYLLLLGSNIERERNLPAAEAALAAEFDVLSRSRLYSSPAVGTPDGPDFFNRAVLVRSDAAPEELRAKLREIELRLGRERGADPNAPRTIDIDILLGISSTGRVLEDPPPDPEIHRFHHVAVPAAEVLPHGVLPGPLRSLGEVAAGLGAPPVDFRVVD